MGLQALTDFHPRRVLPTPPGPVRVVNRERDTVARASFSSLRRPTNEVEAVLLVAKD